MRPSSTVVETLRLGYDAWNRRDVDAGIALLDEEVEWRPPPDSPFAGPHRGRRQVRRFFESMLEAFDELRREPLEFVERGDLVLVRVSSFVRGAGSGVGLEIGLIDVWQLRDGLAISYEVHRDTPEARKALGVTFAP